MNNESMNQLTNKQTLKLPILPTSCLRALVAMNKKMQNEPNFAQPTPSIKYPESRIEQIMQNEPNLHRAKATLFNNEQRTMPALSSVEGNYELFSNEPNLCRF